MDEQPQPTTDKPSLRARIGAAWQTVKTALLKAWAWLKEEEPSVILAAVLVLVVLVLAMTGPGGDHQPTDTPAPAVEAAPGLQDQIDALRLRVIVLEARADALPRPAVAPRASAPRTSVARTGAENSSAITEPQPATAPPKRWGTTDLDREIAAFPSTPSLEQAK